jgi:hypothetical protein
MFDSARTPILPSRFYRPTDKQGAGGVTDEQLFRVRQKEHHCHAASSVALAALTVREGKCRP